jgi:DNA-directed RNA polymerase subunit RPC12/RpoP
MKGIFMNKLVITLGNDDIVVMFDSHILAQRKLLEYSNDLFSGDNKPRCPRCGSSHVTTVRTPDGGHNCMDCHHHFKNRGNKP